MAKKKRVTRLAHLRRSLLLSGEELARRSGVHRVYISEIENERRRPTEEQLRALARELNFRGEPEELLQVVEVGP